MTKRTGSKIVVVGATGNVGTSVLQALGEDPHITSIVGLARRIPTWVPRKTTWVRADIGHPTEEPALAEIFEGADVVIHLAWLFQPTHDPTITWQTNVLGSIRVFNAAAAAKVPTLVYASSVGAYSPGPKDRLVDESWPTHGWPSAAYTVEKAYLERVLDSFERDHPDMRVVRMRPAFIFKRESASEQRRLFAGPLIAQSIIRPSLLPVLPDLAGLRFQAVHAADVGQAYRLAATRQVRGAFNLAAEPTVDVRLMGAMLRAQVVSVPVMPVRSGLAAAWRLHLIPASPYLFDAVLHLPIMDTTRAETELGWQPRYTADEALREFLSGFRAGAGAPTPPLAPSTARGRIRELASGVGHRP